MICSNLQPYNLVHLRRRNTVCLAHTKLATYWSQVTPAIGPLVMTSKDISKPLPKATLTRRNAYLLWPARATKHCSISRTRTLLPLLRVCPTWTQKFGRKAVSSLVYIFVVETGILGSINTNILIHRSKHTPKPLSLSFRLIFTPA